MNQARGSLGFQQFSVTMLSVADTSTTEPQRHRLAEYVLNRRTALGLTQAEVEAAGGPSIATLRKIEGAVATKQQPTTKRDLEKALNWPAGAVDRILAGGEPEDLTQYEARLLRIRDDPDRSLGIRNWAASLLDQIANIYAAEDEEQRHAS
jgi:hypothetical protein